MSQKLSSAAVVIGTLRVKFKFSATVQSHAFVLFLFTILHKAVLNRTFRKFLTVKNWYQFFTAHEELVPIRHILHTNISHFVKFAHIVKLYVAYMRNLHVDKKHPKSAAFCNQFQFFTFYNVVQTD